MGGGGVGGEVDYNISCNYFNGRRCNMLWSIEKGIINCFYRLYFDFFGKSKRNYY